MKATTCRPNLRQLAVLDWLNRWPGLFLREKGRWTAAWHNEAARLHMLGIVARLGGDPSPGESEGRALGRFDGTPACKPATFKVLESRGWIEPTATSARLQQFRISAIGQEALARFGFALKDYTPVRASERASRPVKVSAGLVRRYGGPEAAASHASFHEKQAAQHLKVAARIRASLELWDGSEVQRREEWVARSKRTQR